MNDRKKTKVSSPHLTLVLLDAQSASERAEKENDPNDRALFAMIAESCRTLCGSERFDMLEIRHKKSGELVGFIQFNKASCDSRIEINLTVIRPDNSEKLAAEALKAAAKWAFFAYRGLLVVETWLNPDLSSIRVLERASYTRVFETDGMIRYEKHRPHFPVLATLMLLFTAAGMAVGAITGSYPLFVMIGTVAGILPGALLENLLRRRRMNAQKNG